MGEGGFFFFYRGHVTVFTEKGVGFRPLVATDVYFISA